MMRGFWLLTLLLAASHAERLFIGDQVIRINAESEEQIKLLQALETREELELDFWLSPVSMELPVDIRVPSSSLSSVSEILSANNIAYSVLINDLQERLDEEKFEMMENHIKEHSGRSFNFGAYHRLETIYSWMDTLVSKYSTLVTKLEIGRSYENRPMYVLKFSKGGNKPAIWIDTGIHSREWVSQATGVWTANKIATDYGTDASLTSLLDNMDIYMLILANPDGYDYTHNNDRMWRKTRSENPGSMCRGVDPNRNWDAGFGGPGASRNPCSDSYHGPSAHSEIEVKNVVNFIKNHGNFKSFISVHAYSQLLMYPYGYSCKNAAHQAELDAIGTAAVKKLTSLHGTRYKVGSICNIIYQASGGSIDWSYDEGIKYSFAFELRDTGNSGFLLPPTQIIPTASETWLALKHIMEYVRDHPY
ncbi:carbamoyl-phosphate synthase (glutamine-hydrolyzing) cpa2 [Dissostichus eleginoides]|uniref:Carboxypeptidase A2 n=1 Tax=Dissostichus eleginoides TaxID=100907 RepID=A0AAD9BR69_DISEL|nr:carbamoyl-phosphate synthase (glutamine-hydrolyzing) cpa2 [Dissostichus eleginoides]KAK1887477.1 Carboxypeptidase A2 [Dissostichus eleginoides]